MAYTSISVSPDSTTVLSSINNGSSFTTVYSGASIVGTIDPSAGLAFGLDRFVLAGSAGTAYSLDNGVTWTQSANKAVSGARVYWVGNKFYHTSPTSSTAYSNDGINWVTDSSAITNAYLASNNAGSIVLSRPEVDHYLIQLSTNYGESWQASFNVTITSLDTITDSIPIIWAGSTLGFIQGWQNDAAATFPLYLITSATGGTGTWITRTKNHTDNTQFRRYKDMVYDSTNAKVWIGSNRSTPEIGSFATYSDTIALTTLTSSSSPNRLSTYQGKTLGTSITDTFAVITTNGTTFTNGTARPVSNMSKFVTNNQITLNRSAISTSNATIVNSRLFSLISNALSVSIANRIRSIYKSIHTTSTSSPTVSAGLVLFRQFTTAVSTSTASMPIKKFWSMLWSIIYSVDKWIGVKAGTDVAAISTDGQVWTNYTLPESGVWVGIATNQTNTVAINKNTNIVALTTDGITWTNKALPATRAWSSIISNNADIFVAVALDTNKCATSIDGGLTWTEQTLPQDANWTSITYGNGKFVAVCDYGIAATSTDGVTWTSRQMPDTLQFNSVTWANNQFTAVASGPTNIAATSTNGITWNRLYMPSAQNWTAVGPGVGNPNV